jgi:chloramphenicol 3-O-phosphotransferase
MIKQIILACVCGSFMLSQSLMAQEPAAEKKKGFAVVIDGLTSCGKSSSAESLRKYFDDKGEPVLIISANEMVGYLSPKWQNLTSKRFDRKSEEKGLSIYYDGNREIVVELGPIVNAIYGNTAKVVKTYLDAGINVIIEGVFWNPDAMDEFRAMKKDYEIHTVLLWCSQDRAVRHELIRKQTVGLSEMLRTNKTLFQGEYDYRLETDNKNRHERGKELYQFFFGEVEKK